MSDEHRAQVAKEWSRALEGHLAVARAEVDALRRVARMGMEALEFFYDQGDLTLHESMPTEDGGGEFECPEDESCTCPAAKMFNETHNALRLALPTLPKPWVK